MNAKHKITLIYSVVKLFILENIPVSMIYDV